MSPVSISNTFLMRLMYREATKIITWFNFKYDITYDCNELEMLFKIINLRRKKMMDTVLRYR
jgi:hypothetical protein